MIIIITIKSHSRVLVMACVSMPLRNLSAEAGRKPVQPHPSAVGAGARRSLLLGDRDEISYTTPIQQGTQGPSSTCKLTARALVTNRLHFRRHPVLSNVATHKMKTLGGSKARGCRLYAREVACHRQGLQLVSKAYVQVRVCVSVCVRVYMHV